MSAVASAVPTPAAKATPGIALATRVAGQDTVLPAPLLALLVSLHRARRLDRRAAAGRIAGPPRRDHRPDRSEDGHQRAELRRQGVHGRLRGFDLADLAQPAGRAAVAGRRRAG
ncbi:hypothetical protein G6F46_014074 [Rhizopus delemar]|nr:hypothetical protein G6F46_014074 [Rhizopus delemar]